MIIQIQCKNCGRFIRETELENVPKNRQWIITCGSCKGIITIIVEKETKT